MRIKFGSSALDGQMITLTAVQGSNVAGPVVSQSWGSPPPQGDIEILTDRSDLMVAPDSVRFSVDLSEADFDTQAQGYHPGTGDPYDDHYDQRLHELVFLWDFGEDRTFIAPENVLPAWKNARYARGPVVSHVYAPASITNGVSRDFTVSLTVIEPSSGKMATAQTTVTVYHPDEVYPGDMTVCVNPDGDDDFTGAPTSAARINASEFTSEIPAWTSRRSIRRRWLFKRGATYTGLAVSFDDSVAHGMYFGAYGPDPARPVLPMGSSTTFSIGSTHSPLSGRSDVRISGLRVVGDFVANGDGETWWSKGAGTTFITQTGPSDLVVHDCHVSDASGGFFGSSLGDDDDRRIVSTFHTHFDDCHLETSKLSYRVLCGQRFHPKSSFVLSGCLMLDSVWAPSGDIGSSTLDTRREFRSFARINSCPNVHIRGCDVRSVRGGSYPNIKLENQPDFDFQGAKYNIHSCTFEGGGMALDVAGATKSNAGPAARVLNVVIDGIIHIAGPASIHTINARAMGVTARNIYTLIPGPRSEVIKDSYGSMFRAQNNYDAVMDAAPLQFYSSTLINLRTGEQNGNANTSLVSDGGHLVFHANNVRHAPNQPTPEVIAGLDTQTLLGFTLRTSQIGKWDNKEPPSEITYDTAVDITEKPVPTYAPLGGSPVLGAALTGKTAYLDIIGNNRPIYPSLGAWEMTGT